MAKKNKKSNKLNAKDQLGSKVGNDATSAPTTDKDGIKAESVVNSATILPESKLVDASLDSLSSGFKKVSPNDSTKTDESITGKKKKFFNKGKHGSNPSKQTHNNKGESNGTSKPGEDPKKGSVEGKRVIDLGRVINLRSNRTLTEYVKPEPFNLSILGFDSFTANLQWGLSEEVKKQVRNNVRSNLIGDNVLNLSIIKDLNKLSRNIIPYSVGTIKNGDAAYAAALYSPQARLIELDNSIVNIRQAHNLREQGDSSYTTEGQRNSFWPYSSMQGTDNVHLPYLPNIVDDIKLFSLDGGAMLKSTNRLEVTKPDQFFTAPTCYVLPGIPGFNHYDTTTDIANGNLVARHQDARLYVNREYIYSGDRFTSTRHLTSSAPSWMIPELSQTSSEDVIYYRNQGQSISGLKSEIIGTVNEDYDVNCFASYPDLQYAVISNDFNKLYLLHIANITKNVDNPYTGQLSGLRDKQAFFNAVQSAIHMGTFFRCLLWSILKTYEYAPFVKAKVGTIDYANNYLHAMSPMKKESALSFLKTVNSLIGNLPYNKYSFENFKVWFECSKNDAIKDTFAENNPVNSIRCLFMGISNIMSFAQQPFATSADKANNYTPHVVTASAVSSVADPKSYLANQWGFYVKTLSTQVPIFVPHGDSLCNFFIYFDELFTARPIRSKWRDVTYYQTGQAGIKEPASVSTKLTFTSLLDPLNFTAFAANFFSHQTLNADMTTWFRSYVELVTPFYNYVKSLKGSSATICFDDNEVINMKDFLNNGLIVPDYKQHIISWFNQSPRLTIINPNNRNSAISRFTAPVALVTGHRPKMGWMIDNDTGNTVSTPRIGMPLALSDSYYDFGTTGDALYNTATAWATTATPYSSIYDALGGTVIKSLQYQARNLRSGQFFDGNTLTTPWALYEYFWYPSMWNLPYYPSKHTQIIPGYDFSYQDAGLTISDLSTPDINGYYNGGNIVDSIPSPGTKLTADVAKYISYPRLDSFRDAYVEEYFRYSNEQLSAASSTKSWAAYPVASCLRLTYGSTNRNLVWNWQWIAPNIPGWLGTSALVTRANAISIFTGRNIGSVGLPTSYANVEFNPTVSTSRLYRSELSKDFSESLGLPYLPFLVVSRGAALYLDQMYSHMPYFTHKVLMSDLDLSQKFRNLTDVIANLHTGLYDGEAYPSSDGWGNDLLSHPEKQFSSKELESVK